MAKSSTSFKKGNKAAVGSENSGRPRKYDYIQEAKELDEWSKKPDSTAIYQFTYDKDYLADELDEFADREPVFALALRKAKERIGQNREAHCNAGAMRDCVWARSQTIYHPKLRNHERQDKLFEIEAKMQLEAKSKVTSTPEEVETNKAFLSQVRKLQDSLERNMADKSKSTDNKS
jgi:hypothetical protein